MSDLLKNLQKTPIYNLQFDDFITSDHTKMKPLSVSIAVDATKRIILGAEVSRIPAFGHLAEKSRKYADLGYRRLTADSISNEDIKSSIQHFSYKRHELVGYNYRMPAINASLGISQLKKLNFSAPYFIPLGLVVIVLMLTSLLKESQFTQQV